MIPEWFKVGISVWFLGEGPATEVIRIEKDSWIGQDFDGQGRYPLDEVTKYWYPIKQPRK